MSEFIRCTHRFNGAQCYLKDGHLDGHSYKCAAPNCPGLPWPASVRYHPVNCGHVEVEPKDAEQLELGIALKNEGIERVVVNNIRWARIMRTIARGICDRQGFVTTDDLRKWADKYQYFPEHCNAWGGIFRGKTWKAVGFTKSKIPSNHARRITVWEIHDETKEIPA